MLTRKFRALLFRHGVIDQAIQTEQQRTRPDSIKLLRLKRLRLALKDQLHRIASGMRRTDQAQQEPVGAVRPMLKMNAQGRRSHGQPAFPD